MRNRLLVIATFLLLFTGTSFAQIVGTNCFLQGQWLEIGMCGNGSFGPSSSPAGYHPHLSGTTWTTGQPLAEVYDYGHDGWSIGTPAFMGDYTYPGSPFEGWEIQMAGSRSQAYEYSSTGYSSAILTGAVTGYVHTPGRVTGLWYGGTTVGSATLQMRQETRVDTNASWVVVTTYFYNTTTTSANNVYYLRTCDPDNDESWAGGSFSTSNVVNYQIPSIQNRVEVTATGNSTTHPPLSLATKDCRAVAFVYNFWGLSSTVDLGTVWNKTYSPASFTVGAADPGDIAIGLVYNLGNIGGGDSTVISYAYVFNGPNGIDSAFPDPQLTINHSLISTFPDTLDGCLYPGVDSLPINILYGNDKDWTWGSWTWSPSTGLSSTTGVNNYIHLDAVPGNITYTVTGNDSAANMNDCNRKVFIFTVHSCHLAYSNAPCFGDTLYFGMLGDSIGASYVWYGPGGYVSGIHDPYRFPANWSDTGNYTVVRTIAGVRDTDHVHVVIHPTPPLTLSSNIPVCGAMQSSLTLSALPDSSGESFIWSGPNGYSATGNLPVLTGFDSTDAGTYTVHATTKYGCKSSANINIYPGIVPNFTYVIHPGCTADTVVFTNNTTNADTYFWNFGDGIGSSTNRNTSYIYNNPNRDQVVTVKLSTTNPHCDSSYTTTVDLRHEIHAIFAPTPDTVCFGSSIQMLNTSYSMVQGNNETVAYYIWNFGDGVSYTLDTAFSPIYTYASPGIFPTQLVVQDSIGCIDSITHNVYVLQVGVTGFSDTTLCISQPLPLQNTVTLIPNIALTGWQYQWSPAANLSDTTAQVPMFSAMGTYTYTDTVWLNPWRCFATYTTTIHSVTGKPLSDVTASATIALGSSIQLNADSELIYVWTPNDGSLNNNNINDPIATPSSTTTYTVFGYDVNGCLDSTTITIYVDSSMTEDMPSGFTPDGDGLNDVFKPIGPRFSSMLEFRIFNRWGEELFFSNNKEKGWDGTYHGVKQDIGVYFYQIVVSTPAGGNITYKGSVTLIR